MKPERAILRYFGGKWQLAPWIISYFSEHKVYVEPFGGGASVLLQKDKSELEVYNDLNDEIVNVFRVLQKDHVELARRLSLTPYSRSEYDLSYEKTDEPVERARRTIIRAFVGFGSNGANRINQKTGFRSRLDMKFDEYAAVIPAFVDRLKHVIIENKDAKEVMELHDGPDTLHFVDPPYVHDTRGRSDRYEFELTDDQHRDLGKFLNGLKGKVILCGYENKIYAELGWKILKCNTMADFSKPRTEVLWLNHAAQTAVVQMELIG